MTSWSGLLANGSVTRPILSFRATMVLMRDLERSKKDMVVADRCQARLCLRRPSVADLSETIGSGGRLAMARKTYGPAHRDAARGRRSVRTLLEGRGLQR